MSNRASVLFVDDEKRVLNSMRGMFRREFDLFLTTDGAAAVKIAANNPIDVIVADQRMPGLSGIEVLGQVKKLSPNTIRILLTGYADPSAVEGSINVGEVFRFLGKPCPPKVLRDTLKLAVSATRAAKEPAAPRLVPTAKSRGTGNGRPMTVHRKSVRTDLPVLKPVLRSAPNDVVPHATEQARDVGVVVYTVDSVFAETAIRTVSGERSTMLATSLIKAMQALERDSSGVLITDITTDFARLHRIIGALKQHVPELVTIVVSDNRDSSNMISLINNGQVFRYEVKPVMPNQLRIDIDAAAMKHLKLRENPYLTKRHTVAGIARETGPSAVFHRDIGAVMGLRRQRARETGRYL